jgi:hypothetical protein
MADQYVDFFDYINEGRQPILLDKIEYIDESFEDYKKQKAFNKRLLKEIDLTGNNKLNRIQLVNLLSQKGISLKGYRFLTI